MDSLKPGDIVRVTHISLDNFSDAEEDIRDLAENVPVLALLQDGFWNQIHAGRNGMWDVDFVKHDGTGVRNSTLTTDDEFQVVDLDDLTGEECAALARWRMTRAPG